MTKRWSLLKGGKIREFESLSQVNKALKNWSPFTPILIAKPNSNKFLPPTCFNELASTVVVNYKARVCICILMTLVTTLMLFLGMLIYGSPMFINGTVLFSLITIAALSDYLISFKSLLTMGERTKFFYWVFNSKLMKKITIAWLLSIAALAFFQLFFEFYLVGREPLFKFMGTVHIQVLSGEIWRLVTGPFLHSSPTHFILNAIFLMVIGPLAWCLFSYRSALILIFGSGLGALVSTLLGTYTEDYPYDSYAGISPGVFALFGVVSMLGLIRKNILPQGVALHLGFVAIISIVAASVYTNNSANASHWAGFIFGIILSPLLNYKKIILTEVNVLNFNCLEEI
ncbi:rhomboid family intramembrane serine protease [Pseudoalteromonas sp. APC 3355]|uniref:rhomboid family intramembrane serine protease n=1 Tax=Pseudoalteromonas sp. APC 3355 TaxID=3035199 RepID=UPI0025B40A9D|nr:rhomboid family intramembrane serine protease [Pseudoalteromonas sp. APC 3355]MDN3475259.1 rhomboid family intramembrane serine protease [Pseudoalteromonas sp. APC 3355]